jgi:hypothetical protein
LRKADIHVFFGDFIAFSLRDRIILLFPDEKEKYDPAGFRDAVLQGLNKAGTDLDAVSKFLDTAGSKLDYRRYGETLFDILIAGGLLGKLLHLLMIWVLHGCG